MTPKPAQTPSTRKPSNQPAQAKKSGAAKPAGQTAQGAKKPRQSVPAAQRADLWAKSILTRLERVHGIMERWGLTEVASDYQTAVTALKGAREEIATLGPQWKPSRRQAVGRGYKPGQAITLRDRIKDSYPVEFQNGDLTIKRVMGRRVLIQTASGRETVAPWVDIQATTGAGATR